VQRVTDLRIDKDKTERLVALVLREQGTGPAEANRLASLIISRVEASQAMPVKPGLRGYRMIQESPPWDKRADFTEDVGHYLADVDEHTARALWEWVSRSKRRAFP
jgi:hypothetical protein